MKNPALCFKSGACILLFEQAGYGMQFYNYYLCKYTKDSHTGYDKYAQNI